MSCIVGWNCRGVGVASTVRALRDLVSRHSSSLLFQCETKTRSRIQYLCNILAYDKFFVYEANGLS